MIRGKGVMTTISQTKPDSGMQGIDIAHTKLLSKTRKYLVEQEAQSFLERINRHSNGYLHLDVATHKERTRHVPAYRWRALLVTDNGRYHADSWDFGAVESLRKTLDKLEVQLESRLGKLGH